MQDELSTTCHHREITVWTDSLLQNQGGHEGATTQPRVDHPWEREGPGLEESLLSVTAREGSQSVWESSPEW